MVDKYNEINIRSTSDSLHLGRHHALMPLMLVRLVCEKETGH